MIQARGGEGWGRGAGGEGVSRQTQFVVVVVVVVESIDHLLIVVFEWASGD